VTDWMFANASARVYIHVTLHNQSWATGRKQGGNMQKKPLIVVLILMLSVLALIASSCGGTATTTTSAVGGTTVTTSAGDTTTTTAAAATGEPVKMGFDEGFTGFMAYDVALAEKGILTALSMVNNQVLERPIEYIKVDNGSDPVIAVDKARQLVESNKINFLLGPIFSPAVQAVTDYLGKSSKIPQISILGQPSDNLATANKLAFMPMGLAGGQGYYFGKYCSEQLGYKTVNCIHYEDTQSHQLQAGFEKGFTEGGGTITSLNYLPIDSVDFSSYLTTLKPADATLFWIFGNGAVPFVKQYNDYGLKMPLLIPMANNFSDEQLAELGQMGVGMVACDIYASTVDYPMNKDFIAAFQKLYPGENPTPQAFGGWQAVMMSVEAVKLTKGDTTPAKLIEVMSTMTLETPGGSMTMKPYKDGYIGTRDFFILQTKDVGGGRITWTPLYTYKQVFLGE
jgi:ABC-type branched-subunit amino acid transport system substrate-binding protein